MVLNIVGQWLLLVFGHPHTPAPVHHPRPIRYAEWSEEDGAFIERIAL